MDIQNSDQSKKGFPNFRIGVILQIQVRLATYPEASALPDLRCDSALQQPENRRRAWPFFCLLLEMFAQEFHGTLPAFRRCVQVRTITTGLLTKESMTRSVVDLRGERFALRL